MTPAQVRALFPATARAAYLNAAASSPIATPVEKAITDHYREAMAQGDVGFEAWLARREEIHRHFARFIGAKAGHEVAFIGSTSMGFHIVGQYLRQLGVREVVTLEQEFPSTTLPLLNLGFRLRVVKTRPDGSIAVDDIERAIGPRTGALAVSAVQYASGARVDLAALGRLCRSRGLYFAVNGTQALGQLPIDVSSLGIDFLCGTSHKWLMGGYGVGVFYARPSLVRRCELPMAGWLSVARPMAMDNLAGANRKDAGRQPWFEAVGGRFRREVSALEVGTMSFGLLFGLGAALDIHDQVGVEATQRHNAKLQAHLRQRLRALGFVPNSPDDPDRTAGICVIPVKGQPAAAVRELVKKGVVVTPRGVGIRISTHVYNTEEDVERLLWALQEVGIRPADTRRGPARAQVR